MSASLTANAAASAMQDSRRKKKSPMVSKSPKSLKRRRAVTENLQAPPKPASTTVKEVTQVKGPKRRDETTAPTASNGSASSKAPRSLSKKKKRKKMVASSKPVPDSLLDVPLTQIRKKEKKKSVKTGSVEVHRADFLKWDMAVISKVATSPDGAFMAVARKSSSIELRRKVLEWATVFIVRWDALDETAAVSSITFDQTGNYLLVGRFNGMLDVYRVSPQGLSPHVTLDPGGGSVMSLAVRPGPLFELAVGGEDGRVRFVSIDEEMKDVNLLQTEQPPLPTDPSHYSVYQGHLSNGMCLSLCWKAIKGSDQNLVVCGDSQGGIRWMSGSTKKLLGRGELAQRFNRPSHIWTLQVAANGQHVICGDSHGMFSIWSSTSFTMMEESRFEGMAGDLWDSVLLTSENDGVETVLFGCAGGSVASLKSLVSSNGFVSWTPSRGRPVHSNDIFTMARIGERGIVTGSADTRLCMLKNLFRDKSPEDCMMLQYHEAAGQNPIMFAPRQGLIFSRLRDRIDFWQMPKRSGSDPSLALRLKFPSDRGNLTASAISSDASRIAVAGLGKFSLYDVSRRASEDGTNIALLGSISPSSVPVDRAAVFQGAQDLAFLGNTLVSISADYQQLIILHKDNRVTFVSKSVLGTGAEFLTHIAVCETTKSVSVSDSLGSVLFGKLEDLLKTDHSSPLLAKVANFETERMVGCLRFSEAGNHLCASLADNSLAVLHVGGTKPRVLGVTKRFPSLPTCMSFSTNESSVLLSGHNFCRAVTWKPKPDMEKEQTGSLNVERHSFSKESSILASCVMGPSTVFLAHRPWEAQQASLPHVVPKKMFGI